MLYEFFIHIVFLNKKLFIINIYMLTLGWPTQYDQTIS